VAPTPRRTLCRSADACSRARIVSSSGSSGEQRGFGHRSEGEQHGRAAIATSAGSARSPGPGHQVQQREAVTTCSRQRYRTIPRPRCRSQGRARHRASGTSAARRVNSRHHPRRQLQARVNTPRTHAHQQFGRATPESRSHTSTQLWPEEANGRPGSATLAPVPVAISSTAKFASRKLIGDERGQSRGARQNVGRLAQRQPVGLEFVHGHLTIYSSEFTRAPRFVNCQLWNLSIGKRFRHSARRILPRGKRSRTRRAPAPASRECERPRALAASAAASACTSPGGTRSPASSPTSSPSHRPSVLTTGQFHGRAPRRPPCRSLHTAWARRKHRRLS